MKINDAIREVMKLKDIRVTTLCSRLGLSSAALCGRLKQENISTDKLNEMLRAMDYKVVLVPRESRTPVGGIEID